MKLPILPDDVCVVLGIGILEEIVRQHLEAVFGESIPVCLEPDENEPDELCLSTLEEMPAELASRLLERYGHACIENEILQEIYGEKNLKFYGHQHEDRGHEVMISMSSNTYLSHMQKSGRIEVKVR